MISSRAVCFSFTWSRNRLLLLEKVHLNQRILVPCVPSSTPPRPLNVLQRFDFLLQTLCECCMNIEQWLSLVAEISVLTCVLFNFLISQTIRAGADEHLATKKDSENKRCLQIPEELFQSSVCHHLGSAEHLPKSQCIRKMTGKVEVRQVCDAYWPAVTTCHSKQSCPNECCIHMD